MKPRPKISVRIVKSDPIIDVAHANARAVSSSGYRQDPDRRGGGIKLICVSVYVDQLEEIDRRRKEHHMSRSEYMRRAALGLLGGDIAR